MELNTIFERGSSKIIENVFLLVNIFTLTLDMEKISMQRENRVSSKNSVDLRMLTVFGKILTSNVHLLTLCIGQKSLVNGNKYFFSENCPLATLL